MSKEDQEQYLNYEDAATFVGVNRRTLSRYVKQWDIPKYESGVRKQAFFDIEDLKKLKQEIHRVKPKKV